MLDYRGFGDHTLLTWLKQAIKQKRHKKTVLLRHKLGTPWHTRARREWIGYCDRESALSGELIQRGLGPEVEEIREKIASENHD